MQSSITQSGYLASATCTFDTLRQSTATLLESGHSVVPSLPWAAASLLSDERTLSPGYHLLSDLSSNDMLASAVLRICNSPTYQPRSPLVSISQAANRLGLAALSEIALAAALQLNVFAVEGFQNELRGFWRGALAAALFAKDLGHSCSLPDSETFPCGLLHEIGFPMALLATTSQAKDLGLSPMANSMRDIVLDVSKALSPLAGACVVKAWSLQAPLAQAIQSHHPSFRVTDSPHATIAHMATQMAASLYRKEKQWTNPVANPSDVTAAALPRLGDTVRVWVDSLTV
jgi:HD-like signal output (HDOD) protein